MEAANQQQKHQLHTYLKVILINVNHAEISGLQETCNTRDVQLAHTPL